MILRHLIKKENADAILAVYLEKNGDLIGREVLLTRFWKIRYRRQEVANHIVTHLESGGGRYEEWKVYSRIPHPNVMAWYLKQLDAADKDSTTIARRAMGSRKLVH